ncbi:GIY-YIG nuclease family protein [Blautia stercoris]|jgi:group I intron endonuclease|uniref:GIY-YIG nuclease family protein n=1 Tax=Blautia stercoris TaxID=871664 RepID=UPI00302EE6DE
MNNFFTNIPEYNGIGVYALINNRTGKMYIGASKNVYTRIKQHIYSPTAAIEKDVESGDTFHVEILEKLPSGSNQFDMFGREKYFIDLYDSINHGYNKAPTTCCTKEELLESLQHFKKSRKMTNYILNIIAKREKPIFYKEEETQAMSDLSNKTKYDLEYAKKKLKRIPLDVQKEKYDEIKAAATAAGESVNGYIKKAIDDRMEREAGNDE